MQEIWVVAETYQGRLAPVTLELIGKARALASGVGGKVTAALLGSGVTELSSELIACGADTVLVADHPELALYRTLPYARVLTELIEARHPDVVLFGATSQGRDLAPRLAARLRTGLTADCLDLSFDKDGLLIQTKPSYGDNVMVDIVIPRHRPQMATVRPHVFPAPEKDAGREGRVEVVPVHLDQADLVTRVREVIAEVEEASKLEEADVVVAGGRGMGSKENFNLLYQLARALGGVVGATRPPVDEGWIDAAYQIGQSGKTIAPKLYIACGISGAVQHTVGMEKAKVVVAINKDPSAPIFNFATYGIVGDVREVIPALIAALGAQK
jgi:electron transfer flavoprotein alpha subunit